MFNVQWHTFFHVFGVNALALYVSSELLAILLGHLGISGWVYDGLHAVITPDKWASLAYALYFVLLNFAIGYILYRKKISAIRHPNFAITLPYLKITCLYRSTKESSPCVSRIRMGRSRSRV